MSFRFPVVLDLTGKRCVVVGGGTVAARKVRALTDAGALVTVVAPALDPDLEKLAVTGTIAVVRRSHVEGDLAGAFLAIAATDEPGVNAAVFKEAERERVLLNAVDDVAHCHFSVPAVVRREDFLLTISTGGRAPALAKRLRRELAMRFGPEIGALVRMLGEVRDESLPRDVDFRTWADRWERAVSPVGEQLVRDGRVEEARAFIRRMVRGERGAGFVSIVGAGPGDPRLITVAGRDAIEAADVILSDRLVHPSLLDGKRAIFVGKRAGTRSISQNGINRLMIRLAREGNRVVRLKGGDPFVFGRGGEEASALASAGVPFSVVPAPSSAIAVPAAAGIPVTDRRCSSSVAVVTGRGGVDWERVATATDTIVILMGLATLPKIAGRLIAAGRPAATPTALIENGSLPDQRVVIADLASASDEAAKAGLGSPVLVVVGEVVRLRREGTMPASAEPNGRRDSDRRRWQRHAEVADVHVASLGDQPVA